MRDRRDTLTRSTHECFLATRTPRYRWHAAVEGSCEALRPSFVSRAPARLRSRVAHLMRHTIGVLSLGSQYSGYILRARPSPSGARCARDLLAPGAWSRCGCVCRQSWGRLASLRTAKHGRSMSADEAIRTVPRREHPGHRVASTTFPFPGEYGTELFRNELFLLHHAHLTFHSSSRAHRLQGVDAAFLVVIESRLDEPSIKVSIARPAQRPAQRDLLGVR